MYLKDALFRCARLVGEVSNFYASIASIDSNGDSSNAALREMARKEDERARLLKALGELFAALGDDGPFLVQARNDLAALSRLLETVHARFSISDDAASVARCLEMLEATPRRDLVVGLLECAEPELCRVLRVIDAESRAARKNGAVRKPAGARTREEPAKTPVQVGR